MKKRKFKVTFEITPEEVDEHNLLSDKEIKDLITNDIPDMIFYKIYKLKVTKIKEVLK